MRACYFLLFSKGSIEAPDTKSHAASDSGECAWRNMIHVFFKCLFFIHALGAYIALYLADTHSCSYGKSNTGTLTASVTGESLLCSSHVQ
jgi:hypothetical protein